jgi:hypothetical protein
MRNPRSARAKGFAMIRPKLEVIFLLGLASVSGQGLEAVVENGFPTFIGSVKTVHPGYRQFSLTPEGYAFKVVGMDWLPDGDLALLTIGDTVYPGEPGEIGGRGSVYRLSGVKAATRNDIQVREIYEGFRVPLGLAVADGDIYVSDFNGLEKLVDRDGDGRSDSLAKVVAYPETSIASHGMWNAALIHSDGKFYTALGAFHQVTFADSFPCSPDPLRGTIHVTDKEGHVDFLGSGMREPFGVVAAPDGELFATDNDGQWVPSNKLVHVRKGAFYGMCMGTTWAPGLEYTLPAIWFPHELRSPGQPILFRAGPYKDQMVVGDYNRLTLSRMFLEKVGGEYQGALFPFSGGLLSGALRLAGDENGNLYLGEMAIMTSTESWWVSQSSPTGFGLQKLAYQGEGDSAFEMLAVRAAPNGFNIEFTKPAGISATEPTRFRVQQWRFEPTYEYGGPPLNVETLPVRQATLFADGKIVSLDIPGLKPNRVVHIQLRQDLRSASGDAPWAYETWYTLNAVPGSDAVVRSLKASRIPFSVAAGASGGALITVTLARPYDLRIRNLMGGLILSRHGTAPGVFSFGRDALHGVYTVSIESDGRVHRGRFIQP